MFNNNKNNQKINSHLADEYQDFLAEDKTALARVITILGLILYGAFAIVDYFALKSVFETALIIRSSVMVIFLISFLLTHTSYHLKYYKLIQCLSFGACIVGIEAMLYLASPADQAYHTYYAGVLIVLIALFTFTHVPTFYSGLLAFCALIGYLYIETYIRNFIAQGTEVTVIINMFFFVTAIILGITSQTLRNTHLRKNFFLHKSLQNAYDKKSLEANDNKYLANHDALTDLPNRRHMIELLEKSLIFAKENTKVLVVMFVDLNGFKQVNDVYGHSAGDEVLVIVAKRLELAMRHGDNLSRLGGDEYLMGLMVDKENIDEIEIMANKFIDIISQPMNIEGLRIKVGASIGVAAYPIHGNNIEALIEIADQRMYHAKNRKDGWEKLIDSTSHEEMESVVVFPDAIKNT